MIPFASARCVRAAVGSSAARLVYCFFTMRDTAKNEACAADSPLITAVVVDDEQLARAELIYLLKAHSDVRLVGQGRNGNEALQLVKEHEPDLLFLDINMPGQNGLEVVRKLLER